MDGIEVGHMFSLWMYIVIFFNALYFNVTFSCKKENR